jgi:hypothetical protein
MSTRKGIGHSPLTDKVYLGKQNKAKGMWVGEKEDITNDFINDFINVAFQYFEENTIRNIGSPSSKKENLFINIKNDNESIERVVKNLQKMVDKL